MSLNTLISWPLHLHIIIMFSSISPGTQLSFFAIFTLFNLTWRSSLFLDVLSVLWVVSFSLSLAPASLPESRACDVGFLDVDLFAGSLLWKVMQGTGVKRVSKEGGILSTVIGHLGLISLTFVNKWNTIELPTEQQQSEAFGWLPLPLAQGLPLETNSSTSKSCTHGRPVGSRTQGVHSARVETKIG